MTQLLSILFQASMALGLFAVALFAGAFIFKAVLDIFSAFILILMGIADKIIGDDK